MPSTFKLRRREKHLAMYDNFTEERGFVEMIAQEAEDMNFLDKIMRQDLRVKLQSLAHSVYLPYWPLLLLAIDVPVSFKSGTATEWAENSSQVCDAIYCLRGALAP